METRPAEHWISFLHATSSVALVFEKTYSIATFSCSTVTTGGVALCVVCFTPDATPQMGVVSQLESNQPLWSQKTKKRLSSQSPDLNPIELLWQDVKRTVLQQMTANLNELKQPRKEERAKIPPQGWDRLMQKLSSSYWFYKLTGPHRVL